MPTLNTYLAEIKITRARTAWTTIQAENKRDANALLAAMYGDENVHEVHEVANSEIEYGR